MVPQPMARTAAPDLAKTSDDKAVERKRKKNQRRKVKRKEKKQLETTQQNMDELII